MGEKVNITEAEVEGIINSFPYEPLGNRVIVTVNTEEVDGNLVLSENMLAVEQFVIAVGEFAGRYVSPGDRVMLDLEKLTVKERVDYDQAQVSSQIKVDPIEVEGQVFAMIDYNAIKAKRK